MIEKKVEELKTHPLNASLYDAISEGSEQFVELETSIRENGIIQPLVIRPDGTILSGHRRLQVAKHLGLATVPCEIKEDGDDRLLVVEFNRYRRKTASEIMREAELIKAIIKERAIVGRPKLGEERTPVNTTVETAAAVGMKMRTFAKLDFIYNKAKENPNAKEKLEKVDKGELSIDAAYKALRNLAEDKKPDDIPDFIRFYNSWQFAENDPRFGIPHPGRIPGQIAGNVIYYYTEPGDLVVDPMAGGGSTLDVAQFLGRECLAYDIAPRRPDIIKHDISEGFPDEAKGCQLIFMDPPYWNMKDEGYTDDSASRKSLADFMAWFDKLLVSACHTVRLGGFVAVIIMGQYFRLPEDFECGYIDWPFVAYESMKKVESMRPWARIAVTYPTSLHGGFDVKAAKEGKFMLPVLGDIIIFRRIK